MAETGEKGSAMPRCLIFANCFFSRRFKDLPFKLCPDRSNEVSLKLGAALMPQMKYSSRY